MDEGKVKERKQNMKIYPLYKAIAADYIFYYAIEFLFLTQMKQIEAADVVLGGSFYAIFMIILQIPASIIIDRIGTKKSIVIGNIFGIFYMIIILFTNSAPMYFFAKLISALSFSLRIVADKALLRYSIPESTKQGEIYAKKEGEGYQNYFYLNAITAILSGFLYVLNPYIPIVCSLGFTIMSAITALAFHQIEEKKSNKNNTMQETKKYVREFKQGISFIIKSQRLRSLFLYTGIVWGIFCLMGTYQSSLLVDIGAPAQVITIIAGIYGIASGIGSKKQVKLHNRFRNHTLSIILLAITSSILLAGILGIMHLPYMIALILIVLFLFIINVSKGMTQVLTSRYLSNFSNQKILTQILAVNEIGKNIFNAMIGFLGSYLLRITNTGNSMIIVGIILLITALGLISYMRTRVGLKPEEYDSKEIYEDPVK